PSLPDVTYVSQAGRAPDPSSDSKVAAVYSILTPFPTVGLSVRDSPANGGGPGSPGQASSFTAGRSDGRGRNPGVPVRKTAAASWLGHPDRSCPHGIGQDAFPTGKIKDTHV